MRSIAPLCWPQGTRRHRVGPTELPIRSGGSPGGQCLLVGRQGLLPVALTGDGERLPLAPAKQHGKRGRGAPMAASISGAISGIPHAATRGQAASIGPHRSMPILTARVLMVCWLWPATCGSGRGACGGRVGKGQTTDNRTGRLMGVRTSPLGKRNAVCCGAARATTTASGSCGVPLAAGTSRTVWT